MIDVLEYNLPDVAVKLGKPDKKLFVWQPSETYIVLGRSNNAEESLISDTVSKDKITVLQRPSGGETVLLSPQMLVMAALIPIVPQIKSRDYFVACNNVIMNVLSKLGVEHLSTKGISDISIGLKKIVGSAIYRSQEAVFYHAVLNVNEDINLIGKYLKHPKREPDYRLGRTHSEFVTSLWEQNYRIDIERIKTELENKVVVL